MTTHRDFGILLGLAYQSFVDQLRAHLARRGFADLGPAYGYVLRAVASESMNQRDLAQRLGITAQGAGKVIREMLKSGYLRRDADVQDARAVRLSLGPRGRELLSAARRFHKRYEDQLTKDLGTSAAALRTALSHIANRAGGDADRRLRSM